MKMSPLLLILMLCAGPLARGAEGPRLHLSHDGGAGIADERGKVTMICRTPAWDGAPKALELRHRVIDWRGQVVTEEAAPAALKVDGNHRIELVLPAYGAYFIHVELRDATRGTTIASATRRVAHVVPALAWSAEARLRSPMGVDVDGRTASWEMLGRLGVHWARGADLEPHKEKADASGVSLLTMTPGEGDAAAVHVRCSSGKAPPELAREVADASAEDPREPLGILDQVRQTNHHAQAAGKRAWLTGAGWNVTGEPAISEPLQAVYLPRLYMLAIACGAERVFWAQDRDADAARPGGRSGLLEASGDPRPSAAAYAALSKLVAQARFAGTIDLGPDLWCILFRQLDGSHVAGVWSVRQEHALPRDLHGAAALDLFGNTIKPERIGPEVTYFLLPALPDGWEGQRQVRWEGLDAVLTPPGTPVRVRIHCPEQAAKATWTALPHRVQATPWQREGDGFVSVIAPAADFVPGSAPLGVRVEGPTWRRHFEPTLSVVPPVRVLADAYTPGEVVTVALGTRLPQAAEALVQTRRTAGSVAPGVLTLAPGSEAKTSFIAAADARGVVPLYIRLPGGLEHTHWLRPTVIDVPRAQRIDIDGRLTDWPAASRLDSRHFATNALHLPVEAYVAHTEAGLYVAARLAVNHLQPADPGNVQYGSAMELLLDIGGTMHELRFCPVKQGEAWHLHAGRRKSDGGVVEAAQCHTAIRVEHDSATFEAFVPAEALGGANPVGSWRALLSLRVQDDLGQIEGAWPRAKATVQAPAQWGLLRFSPQ